LGAKPVPSYRVGVAKWCQFRKLSGEIFPEGLYEIVTTLPLHHSFPSFSG
jgi:hypothetical protein